MEKGFRGDHFEHISVFEGERAISSGIFAKNGGQVYHVHQNSPPGSVVVKSESKRFLIRFWYAQMQKGVNPRQKDMKQNHILLVGIEPFFCIWAFEKRN